MKNFLTFGAKIIIEKWGEPTACKEIQGVV